MQGGNFHRIAVNALTLSRVPLIFAYMAFAVLAEFSGSAAEAAAACCCMFLAGISDLFDGILARRWKVVSNFGKLADPLMDKVFFIVSFPTLAWLAGRGGDQAHALVLLVFTVLYILRDQWVTFMRAVAAPYGADTAAMWLGKVRTALSFPAAGAIYLYLAFGECLPLAAGKAALCAIYAIEAFLGLLNIYSCMSYTKVYWPYVKRSMGVGKE